MIKQKEKQKKEGVFSRLVLIGIFTFLFAFVVAVFIVFNASGGSEPSTLIVAVFAFCGLESGVLGWIKTYKERMKLNEELAKADEAIRERDKTIEELQRKITALEKARFSTSRTGLFVCD